MKFRRTYVLKKKIMQLLILPLLLNAYISDQGQFTVKGSSIPGKYFRLGYVKVPRIEEAFD